MALRHLLCLSVPEANIKQNREFYFTLIITKPVYNWISIQRFKMKRNQNTECCFLWLEVNPTKPQHRRALFWFSSRGHIASTNRDIRCETVVGNSFALQHPRQLPHSPTLGGTSACVALIFDIRRAVPREGEDWNKKYYIYIYVRLGWVGFVSNIKSASQPLRMIYEFNSISSLSWTFLQWSNDL